MQSHGVGLYVRSLQKDYLVCGAACWMCDDNVFQRHKCVSLSFRLSPCRVLHVYISRRSRCAYRPGTRLRGYPRDARHICNFISHRCGSPLFLFHICRLWQQPTIFKQHCPAATCECAAFSIDVIVSDKKKRVVDGTISTTAIAVRTRSDLPPMFDQDFIADIAAALDIPASSVFIKSVTVTTTPQGVTVRCICCCRVFGKSDD
jgi:hypothetical protein